ncbi:MAG: GNAT family N-acetyltransferase, partial [Kiloniellaceae bacterium]
ADSDEISAWAMEAFDQFIAPDHDQTGRQTFARSAAAEAIDSGLGRENEGFLAAGVGRIIGFVEMRGNHMAMLFVKREQHRQDMARRLLEHAPAGREGAEITMNSVNSAPSAENAYEGLGLRRRVAGSGFGDHDRKAGTRADSSGRTVGRTPRRERTLLRPVQRRRITLSPAACRFCHDCHDCQSTRETG